MRAAERYTSGKKGTKEKTCPKKKGRDLPSSNEEGSQRRSQTVRVERLGSRGRIEGVDASMLVIPRWREANRPNSREKKRVLGKEPPYLTGFRAGGGKKKVQGSLHIWPAKE